ncbi:class I adenylate-forming enzyme family protein [Nocardia sp. alder85J]|uniref:class I adenylate-forming enzyme family protein n=1 Tax=Nocardia sp. alder85J TaxID=2862949 RepID=UPI001CD54D8A|nr:AMP-binding protein [Nocardia sp. alder85J]MCX4095658.1 AMP-binding protein [Nocardia sp. alder85J]
MASSSVTAKRLRPFDESGVVRRPDGVLAYSDLPPSLVAMLRTSRERYGSRCAVTDLNGASYSYDELWKEAAAVAGGLRAQGIGRGDRVALYRSNDAAWVIAYFAVQMAGGVVVPINTRLSTVERDSICADAGVSASLDSGRLPTGPAWTVDDLEPTEIAALLYTSGTTGEPKGVIAEHRNIVSISETQGRVTGYRDAVDLVNLISVPLFHVTGCNAQMIATLRAGGTVVIMPKFDVRGFLDAVEQYAVTAAIAVPAIYAMVLADPITSTRDLSTLESALYGGAPMSPALISKLRAALPGCALGNGFGLTETASVSTFLPDQWCDERPETVGFATPVVELDLLEPDEHGVGELLIRGENVSRGYWNRPDLARNFADGWLHTGDLARIDDQGFCEIVDRRKDMIIRGGENVYCVEVENVLVSHPAVLEAAVVGVPDEVMGERVGAVVVTGPERDIDALGILRHAAERLAKYKLPEFISVTDEQLPRNPGGKVVKARVKDRDWGRIVRL